MLFDTHAHLNSEKYLDNLDEIVKKSFDSGVTKIVVNGYDIKSSVRAIEIANMYDGVYATVGIHPLDIDCFNEGTIEELREMAKDPKVVAIGEIGIDLYYDKSNKDAQIKMFKKQLELASELDLPITVHSREALDVTYQVLKEYNCKGIMHCYSGSLEYAQKFIELGYYISLAGPVTFKNARVAKEVASGIDLNKLLIETDCPYLTPHPFRGKVNDPSYVSYVAEEIARLRNLEYEDVCKITYNNSIEVYQIETRDKYEVR